MPEPDDQAAQLLPLLVLVGMAPDEGGALQHASLVQQHPVGAVRDLAVRALAPHRQLAFGAVGQDEEECVRPRKRLDEHRLAEQAHKRLPDW